MDNSVRPSVPQQRPATDTSSAAAGRHLSSLELLLESLDETTQSGASPHAQTDALHQQQLSHARLGVAGSLFTALRAKHAPTAAHSLRVSLGCSSWALAVNLPENQRDEIEIAALLHDIGKIGVPDHILLKPGRLTSDEYASMEKHRQSGLEIIAGCCVSKEVLDIVHYASARFDGGRQGFDRSGDDLPLGSRMVAIIDAFDAMTTDHVYRRAMSRERALAELFENAGGQFDPNLIKQFCGLIAGDQVKLNANVARRWLQDLQPDASNSLWSLGRLPQPAGPQSVENLFQQKLLDSMHDAVVFVDTGQRVLLWNRAAERMTGISATSVYQKQWSPELVGMGDEQDQRIEEADCPVAYAMGSVVQTIRRLTIAGRGDQRLAINAHIAPVLGRDGVPHGATLLLHDASSQITLEERVQLLHEKATHDPLTQIANRAEFDRVHSLFIETHLERALPCSLIICDLDFFKKINDNYGHQAGDDALISFAAMLRRFCRAGDLVARYGGEEFVMLCADCDNATATARADELRRELSETPQPMLKGKCITASFGVTEIQGGDTVETMLRRSDRALLQAKDLGRNRVVQLGSGITGNEPREKPSGWFSWLRRDTTEHLLHRMISTALPINVAVEKLRGFVADHQAEITTIQENHIVLNIDGQHATLVRRHNDRPIPFVVELKFTETNSLDDDSSSESLPTKVEVIIHPTRDRDRRVRNLDARAKHLMVSLKSYLMAQDVNQEEIPREVAGPRQGFLASWFGKG